MRDLGPVLGLFATCLVGALAAPASADLHTSLDHYALFAIEELRAQHLTATSGDLGVHDGALRSRGTLDAPASQLAATSVRLDPGARCAGILANSVDAPGPDCPTAGTIPPTVLEDVPAACGYPATFPACAAGEKLVIRGSQALQPGVYGDVVVAKSGGTGALTLRGGTYVFCSLKVTSGSRVSANAPSRVLVAGNLKLGAEARLGPAIGGALTARDVQVLVAGARVDLARASRVGARLCAPQARLSLRRGTLDGTLVAREIRTGRATVGVPYVEERAACADRDPLRRALFGDLHVHTGLSFDAQAFDVRTTPADAYAFAQGAPVGLPPLDMDGAGTRVVQIDRPLDFAAVTDHSEYLGEVEECSTPGSPNYDSATCQTFRGEDYNATTTFGLPLALNSGRFTDVCGPGPAFAQCMAQASQVWQRVQDAAEDAYDRTDACTFTSFVGYEYTSALAASTRHRNVIFRNDRVPFPTTFFEQPTPRGLWNELRTTCIDAGTGCDVLAIPHNSNESNGNMFFVEYPGAAGISAERAQAELRGNMEPLLEVYQHKGDSECMNGISGVIGASDEQCEFEKDPRPFEDCGDGRGFLGVARGGCFSRLDFARGVLLAGLQESERLGVNPYRVGLIASTDTHNGTPGMVAEDTFVGHRGLDDDTPADQLGNGVLTPGGIQFSPGGLVGVWAEENSRPAIFDALRRREVFGTSGPRIAVRFFGGFGIPPGLCSDPEMVAHAYASGVPMGDVLPPAPAGPVAPSFLVTALRDAGTIAKPGTQLQRLQVVKGWTDANGDAHQQVFDVAGDPDNGADVDLDTCVPSGAGFDSLCTVWTDPAFDPAQHAFYYVRALENPTCRWNTVMCNALAPPDRPPACTDPGVKKSIQERAWTSPIWFRPAAT